MGKIFTAILITAAAIVTGKNAPWVVVTGEVLSSVLPPPSFLVTSPPYHHSFSPPSALLSPHIPAATLTTPHNKHGGYTPATDSIRLPFLLSYSLA